LAVLLLVQILDLVAVAADLDYSDPYLPGSFMLMSDKLILA
jgi:hypothetical protein